MSTYISVNQCKVFRFDAVQGFDFYPQRLEDQKVDTLRVILSGGDQWYEGAEAVSLHRALLGYMKKDGAWTIDA